MKKSFLGIIIIVFIFYVTGCDNKNVLSNDVNKSNTNLDHKVYNYMKISSGNTSGLLNIAYIFDDPSGVGHGDDEYNPCFIASFDSKTGKATSVKYYAFFLDYLGSSEWVDKAIEKFNSTSSSYKSDFSNVTKGRVNDSVTYLVVDIDSGSRVFNQYVQMLFYEQDIKEYKDKIYYSRLYNYSNTPPVEVGDNYFEESLENIRIEWSDNVINAF